MSNWMIVKETETNFLVHYGVQGMKWGVRNFIDENGHLTEAGKQRYTKTNGQYHISGSLSKKKQSIQSLKDRISALKGMKDNKSKETSKELKDRLKSERADYSTASKAERAAYQEAKKREREALKTEQANLKSISNYIRGNKMLMKALSRNQNMRFKGGQNKKIDFEQVIGNYNKRTQEQINARKANEATKTQNLKNENERLKNMDIREATSEENMKKIRERLRKNSK